MSAETVTDKQREDYIIINPCFNIHNGIGYVAFFAMVKDLQNKLGRPLRIVELGTKRWVESAPPTHHKEDFRNSGIDVSNYVLTDYIDGIDVDVNVDIHTFTKVFPEESIDVIYSGSTYEHIKYPWIASYELMKSLKIGGIIFIVTHQTFPLHAYPGDYYRFSRKALESLYPAEMGMKVINSWYDFLNRIVNPGHGYAESYSNVNLITVKEGKTSSTWIYKFE